MEIRTFYMTKDGQQMPLMEPEIDLRTKGLTFNQPETFTTLMDPEEQQMPGGPQGQWIKYSVKGMFNGQQVKAILTRGACMELRKYECTNQTFTFTLEQIQGKAMMRVAVKPVGDVPLKPMQMMGANVPPNMNQMSNTFNQPVQPVQPQQPPAQTNLNFNLGSVPNTDLPVQSVQAPIQLNDVESAFVNSYTQSRQKPQRSLNEFIQILQQQAAVFQQNNQAVPDVMRATAVWEQFVVTKP